MANLFEGKVAVVTGGSSGIGRASALAFAAEGAKVVVSARRSAEGEETIRLVSRSVSLERSVVAPAARPVAFPRVGQHVRSRL